jgi:hypothetical protein
VKTLPAAARRMFKITQTSPLLGKMKENQKKKNLSERRELNVQKSEAFCATIGYSRKSLICIALENGFQLSNILCFKG